MRVWKRALWWAIPAVAVGFGLVVWAGWYSSAIRYYLYFLGAIALIQFLRWLAAALPAAPSFGQRVDGRATAPDSVQQYEAIKRRLALAESSSLQLHTELRPFVREIAAVRLARRGVNLYGDPSRAHEVIGDGPLWELVRPDRARPADRFARGWPRTLLEKLVEELEAL